MAISQINYWPYEFLAKSKKRINWLYGGASSSKSWTIVQYLILEKLCKEKNIGILVCRKTKPAVRASCLRLFEYWLHQFGISYRMDKSALIIPVGTNKVYFDSIDDIEKKKSIEGINYMWLEEVTELTEREFLRLNIGCRAKNENGINQLFGSFNPIDPIGNEWLKTRTDNPGKDEQVMVLVYTDNPFLSIPERNQIEALIGQDEEYDKIYRQGKWGTPSNLIYNNWEITHKWPERFDETVYGVDFGFNNPTAIVEVSIFDGQIYEQEILYESHVTNSQLINKMQILMQNHYTPLIADSAEPQRITEIRTAGVNVHPCRKGKDSVKRGIDIIRRRRPFIDYNSPNLIKELQGYKWKQDRDGNVLDEPLKFKDHLMDARRYAYAYLLDKINAGMVMLGPSKDDKELPEFDEDGDEMWNTM